MANCENKQKYPSYIRCPQCWRTYSIREINIHDGCIDCAYCKRQLRLDKVEKTPNEDDCCEKCGRPVGLKFLQLGYMRSEFGRYEIAMLCGGCSAYDPIL